jgi:SAM-dependent methyltransferase
MIIKDPSFNYDKFGHNYSGHRQPDPRICNIVWGQLGDAKIVLNVGAGTGSYEPEDRYVLAVEPSITMRQQRKNKVPAIGAKADNLPFDDNAFDAVMAMVTIHHWPDIGKGLGELRRVAKDRVLVLTFDPETLNDFWAAQYFKEMFAIETVRFPTIDKIKKDLGGSCDVIKVPVPFDCVDGFMEGFYGRPEEFLKNEIRRAQSAWGFIKPEMEEVLVKRLSDDLSSGVWDKKYGYLRTQPFFEGALTLVVANL